MRYMLLIAGSEDEVAARDGDEDHAADGRIEAWWDDHVRAGRIVGGQRLAPSSAATTVRIGPNDGSTISDGPFTQAAEVVGGYAIVDVADLDAAIKLAASWPHVGAAIEIRPVMRG